MDDLISRKQLLNEIEHNHPEYNDGQDIADWQMQCIINAPTVAVQPVKCGKWIWDNNGIDWDIGAWVCSECGMRNANIHSNGYEGNPYIWSGTRFCPNCGAKMDREAKHEENKD